MVVVLFLCACATTPAVRKTDAEQVVEQIYAAYNARDFEKFIGLFAPEVEIFRPPQTLWLSGIDAVREYYGPRFTANPNARGTSISRIVHGPYVVDQDHVTGSSTGPDRTVVWIYEIRERRIVRAWVLP